jgi:hypothetical protein
MTMIPIATAIAHHPAHGAGGGEDAEADCPEVQPLLRIEDEHRPCGAEGDVENEDGQHERADTGMVKGPSAALYHLGSQASGDRRRRSSRQRDPRDHHGADTDEHGLADERQGPPGGEQHRTESGTGELVERDDARQDSGVGKDEVMGLRGDEQRTGRNREAVPQTGRPRGRDQPPKSGAKTSREQSLQHLARRCGGSARGRLEGGVAVSLKMGRSSHIS